MANKAAAWATIGFLVALLCNAAPAAANPEQWKLSIAYCTDCVPFHFKDADGRPAGMIIDLWRLWSDKTGPGITFRAASWDDTRALVKRGEADLHAGLFFSEARAKYLEYGSFLAETEIHIFAHKQLPEIDGLAGAEPYKVGGLSGDFVENYLRLKLPRGNVRPFKTDDATMAALAKGELQLFAADTPTGIYHLQKAGLGFDFRFDARSRLYRNKWLVAATRGNQSLIAEVERGMRRITEDERETIVAK